MGPPYDGTVEVMKMSWAVGWARLWKKKFWALEKSHSAVKEER